MRCDSGDDVGEGFGRGVIELVPEVGLAYLSRLNDTSRRVTDPCMLAPTAVTEQSKPAQTDRQPNPPQTYGVRVATSRLALFETSRWGIEPLASAANERQPKLRGMRIVRGDDDLVPAGGEEFVSKKRQHLAMPFEVLPLVFA